MPIASLADVVEMERVPLGARDIPRNTYDMLRAGASLAPDEPALTFFADAKRLADATVWTHRELLERITQAAHLFRRLGVERNDAVAFILPNLPETHLTIWGAEAAGIAFAVNPLQEREQIAALLKAVEPKVLVTLAPTPGLDLFEKTTAAAQNLSALRCLLAVSLAPGAQARDDARLVAGTPVLEFEAELRKERGDALAFALPDGEAISSYFCTGGTTGSPKIARRTHRSETFDCWALTQFADGLFAPRKTIFCGLPLFHVNGQLVTGLAPWSAGSHVVMGTPQGYRGEGVIANFWEIVERFRVNVFSGVPTVYSSLLQVPIGGRDISSLECAFCGAAPMPAQLFKAFQQETGVRIVEGYGLTEGACVSSGNPMNAPPRIGSIGIRYPYQEMRALILDNHGAYARDAATDEIGVIAIRGPNVFAGYLDPTHDRGVWIDRCGETWLNTGDLGRQDADGYFWLTGRKKELIIRGGHNIDPRLIEEPLHRHPDVALAAAIGRPDARAGEIPVAYVQLKPGRSVCPDALLAFAQGEIPERAAWPKEVRVVDRLPLTNVGKIFKPDLQQREIEHVVRAEAATCGAEFASLKFERDPVRGVITIVEVTLGAQALRTALAKYAFAVDVVEFGRDQRVTS